MEKNLNDLKRFCVKPTETKRKKKNGLWLATRNCPLYSCYQPVVGLVSSLVELCSINYVFV